MEQTSQQQQLHADPTEVADATGASHAHSDGGGRVQESSNEVLDRVQEIEN